MIATRSENNIVVFNGDSLVFKGGVLCKIAENKTVEQRISTPSNTTIFDVDLPDGVAAGECTYTLADGFVIIDQDSVDSRASEKLEENKRLLIEKAKEKRGVSFYTNISIPFPSDEKIIHFRNEIDRSNIRDKGFAASKQIDFGNGDGSTSFKPKDAPDVTMTNAQLFTCLMSVGVAKDIVWKNYGVVIQQTKDATTEAELNAAKTALNAL